MMRGVIAVACLLITTASAADVLLLDQTQLATSLREHGPCCVIDARDESSRQDDPLADALVYRDDLSITPTAAVVVIADIDARAVEVGARLAARSGAREVLAVKGGIAAWRNVLAGAGAAAAETDSGMPSTFIIPRNTCEQGAPLQELPFDVK